MDELNVPSFANEAYYERQRREADKRAKRRTAISAAVAAFIALGLILIVGWAEGSL